MPAMQTYAIYVKRSMEEVSLNQIYRGEVVSIEYYERDRAFVCVCIIAPFLRRAILYLWFVWRYLMNGTIFG
jgi:hypothetical protein